MFIQFKQKLERAHSKGSFDAAGRKQTPPTTLTIQFGSAKEEKNG